MSTSPILQLGNPQLRQVAQPISNVADAAVQTLIDRLLTLVQDSNGVGIAAPQIGEPLRLIIVASRPNPRYPYAPTMEPLAMINPQILHQSEQRAKGWEGCLSVPGIRGLVPRAIELEVEYTTRHGQVEQQTFTDFVARIIQHELDHLDGNIFLDRVESTHDLMSEQEYQQRIVGV
jgi:peptide deformylase